MRNVDFVVPHNHRLALRRQNIVHTAHRVIIKVLNRRLETFLSGTVAASFANVVMAMIIPVRKVLEHNLVAADVEIFSLENFANLIDKARKNRIRMLVSRAYASGTGVGKVGNATDFGIELP